MRVFVIAWEPSGDKLGAALMAGLRKRIPDADFQGIGGDRMEAEGLQSLFPMSEISIMGISEILKEYRSLKARIRQTAQAIVAAKPDVLVTIDLPEFSLRGAKQVKAASDIRTVHYVAPTVWAWRAGRAEKMATHVDQVLALLPFEPPYLEKVGLRCDFVGHPVVTDLQATEADAEAFRASNQINGPLALLLPGSRRSEVTRLLPVLKDVADQLSAQRPELKFVLPMARAVAPIVKEQVAGWANQPLLIEADAAEEKRAAFKAADIAIAASGTVSLELAAAQTPMVIAYDMGWLSRQIIGRMLKVDTVTLVNLVSESRAIPEFIAENCRAELIVPAVLNVLDDPSPQIEAMERTMQRLGHGDLDPGLRAADAVIDGVISAQDGVH